MMRAGQRSQVKLSRPHIEVSPPPVAGYSSNAHFTLALVYVSLTNYRSLLGKGAVAR